MSTALDVAIGLIFLYLLLSLFVVTVQELVASVFEVRAKHLYRTIESMLRGATLASGETAQLGSQVLVERLYRHPLLKNLVEKPLARPDGKLPLFGRGLPAYIPSKTFALALIDVLQGESASRVTGAAKVLASAKGSIANLADGELKTTLALLLDDVDELETATDKRAALVSERVEAWFNDRMARASGWYKRKAQFWSFVIAALATLAFDADTLHVAERLWRDAELRAVVVAAAQAFREQHAGDLLTSRLPIGWQEWGAQSTLPFVVLGWLLTSLAVSLGAPFWFDVLSKIVQLRSSGAKVSAATGEIEAKK